MRGAPAQPATAANDGAQRTYRGSIASQPTSGTAVERSRPGSATVGGATTPLPEDRYVRRASPATEVTDPRNDTDSRARAVPRAYPSYGVRASEMPRPGMNSGPGSTTIPRTAPEASRPASPEYRPYGYGVERRAPGVERPSGPPPASAPPPMNPGVNRSAPGPENRGGGSPPPQGGHSRGGQPSTGTAAPRGRG